MGGEEKLRAYFGVSLDRERGISTAVPRHKKVDEQEPLVTRVLARRHDERIVDRPFEALVHAV